MSSLPQVAPQTEQDPSRKKKWLIWTVAGLLVVGVVIGCSLGFTLGKGEEQQSVAGASSQTTIAPGSITSKKTKYSIDQKIEFSFENPDPYKDDWIAVAKSGSEKDGFITGAKFVTWTFACGDQHCEEAVNSGKLSIPAGTVPEGTYQAYIIVNADEPYVVKGSSEPFTVHSAEDSATTKESTSNLRPAADKTEAAEATETTETTETAEATETTETTEAAETTETTETAEASETTETTETTEATETAETTETTETEAETNSEPTESALEGSQVSMLKKTYARDEEIKIVFHNHDPSRGDWIAVAVAGEHKNGKLRAEDKDIKAWLYACGDVNCSKKKESGELTLKKNVLKPGTTYQAYLLKTDRGAPYRIKAMSEEFNISADKFPKDASSDE